MQERSSFPLQSWFTTHCLSSAHGFERQGETTNMASEEFKLEGSAKKKKKIDETETESYVVHEHVLDACSSCNLIRINDSEITSTLQE